MNIFHSSFTEHKAEFKVSWYIICSTHTYDYYHGLLNSVYTPFDSFYYLLYAGQGIKVKIVHIVRFLTHKLSALVPMSVFVCSQGPKAYASLWGAKRKLRDLPLFSTHLWICIGSLEQGSSNPVFKAPQQDLFSGFPSFSTSALNQCPWAWYLKPKGNAKNMTYWTLRTGVQDPCLRTCSISTQGDSLTCTYYLQKFTQHK